MPSFLPRVSPRRMCAVLLLQSIYLFQYTHAGPETSEMHVPSFTYNVINPRIDRTVSKSRASHNNEFTRLRRRRLDKGSKKSPSSVEEFTEEDVLQDFENLYGPLMDILDSGEKSSKKSKKGGGPSYRGGIMSMDFSMIFSMEHEPKASKSAKYYRHSKREKSWRDHPTSPADSDALRTIPDPASTSTSPGQSTSTASPGNGETSDGESNPAAVTYQEVNVTIAPYTILYQLTDDAVPLPDQYSELTIMTGAFLEHLFKTSPGIDELSTIKTDFDTSFVSSSGTIGVRFQTVVSYDPLASAPSSDQLESRIQQAFAGTDQTEYISRLKELREGNVFSSTVAVGFYDSTHVTSQRQEHKDNSSSKAGTIVGATLGTLLLLLSTCTICRRRKRTGEDKLEKATRMDMTVDSTTVAETRSSNDFFIEKSESSQQSSEEESPQDHTATSSSVYTSGQSYAAEDESYCRSDTTSVMAAASFDSIYTPPPVRFALNSFERALREEALESSSNRPVRSDDESGEHDMKARLYPWPSKRETFVVTDEHEADSKGEGLDLASSYSLSLSQDVKRELESVGLLHLEQLMDNDDCTISQSSRMASSEEPVTPCSLAVSVVAARERDTRQQRNEKVQFEAQLTHFEDGRDAGSYERTQYIDQEKAESIRRSARSLLLAASGALSETRLRTEWRRPDVSHQQDEPSTEAHSHSRSNVVSTGSAVSISTECSKKPGRQRLDQKTPNIVQSPEDGPVVLLNTTRARPRGKAPEFIAAWSDKTQTKHPDAVVEEESSGMKYHESPKRTDEPTSGSIEETSERETAYGMARTMNRLYPDGREPWWRADEKSMTRRNRMSFKRAHYSRNAQGEAADDDSVTSHSDTLSHTERYSGSDCLSTLLPH